MRIKCKYIYRRASVCQRDAAVEGSRFVSCTGDPAGEEAVVDAKACI